MKIEKLNYSNIPQLSNFDKAYQAEDSRLIPFLELLPHIDNFRKSIEKRNFSNENRKILHQSLTDQYNGIEIPESVQTNIDLLLSPNSFTVTTAHQPSLFTGPLYFIYKIAGTVNLCKKLKSEYPDYNFVPVYYMGSEDHDFEEINHINLFGKKLTWEDNQGGSVGKYECESLEPLINELSQITGVSETAEYLINSLKESYLKGLNYEDSTFRFVNTLFGKHGLVVLIPGSTILKKLFIPIIKDDVFNNSSYKYVSETVTELEKAGFSNQAYVRPINLFYLLPNKRERIEKENEVYKVLNTDIQFSASELEAEIDAHPERFSPNVILRPLYQEIVLPNLAYIGGGGELAYWIERKSQFQYYGIPYPILIRRNSLQWIDNNSVQRLEKLGLKTEELFWDTDMLIRLFLEHQSASELNFAEERIKFQEIFESVYEKINKIDASLEATAAAQKAQLFNTLEKLEGRLLKSEKQKQETSVNQIRKLQEKMGLPGSLQERKENFIQLYLKYGSGLIDFLVDKLNPLEKDFLLIFE